MTLDELSIKVAQELRGKETRYELTDQTKVYSVISSKVIEFSELTYGIYRDDTVLTLQAHVGLYDLYGAQFSRKVLWPTDVFIENAPLLDFDGNRGRVSHQYLTERHPDYKTWPENKPSMWLFNPPRSIQLLPVPAQVYANCSVNGFVQHLALDSANDEIEFQTNAEWPLVKFVAAGFVRRIDDPTFYDGLMTESMSYAQECKADALRRFQASVVKGRRRGRRNIVRLTLRG